MNKRIIHSVFEQQAALAPGNIAVKQGAEQLTYRQLNEKANVLAHTLRRLGLARETAACTLMPPGTNLITSLLGIFKAGGIYMPLDIAFPAKNLRQSLLDTGADFCITDGTWYQHVQQLLLSPGIAVKYLLLLDEDCSFRVFVRTGDGFEPAPVAEASVENPALINDPKDGNYIFYSSGSTGDGKAILGCHDSLSHFIHWELKEFGLQSNLRSGQLSQHTFDASMRDIFVPLCAGATLCIPPVGTKESLPALVQWMKDEGIMLIHTVPSMFRVIAKELLGNAQAAEDVQEHLAYVFLAGEHIYVQDILQWKKAVGKKVEFVNLYGATEVTMAKTFNRITSVPADAQASAPVHAGKPISNAAIAIVNDGMLCGIGEIGEIYIITPFITKGYYKNPEKTAQSFVQNPLVHDRQEIVYRTGDYGRYLPGHYLEVLGRIDDQVKVNGIRVELTAVKQAVLRYKGIKETEIIAHKDAQLQVALICYFVGDNVDVNDLRSFLAGELSRAVVPSYFIPLEEFPLTINGKVDKKMLPKPEEILLQDAGYEIPASETEEKLEAMCREILGMKRFGRKLSFFKAGGTSLKAMQYISRIYKEFGITILLRDVFENDTVEKLGTLLQGSNAGGYSAIPQVATAAWYPLSHAQKRLWLADQFNDDRLRYNMTYASTIKGELSIEILKKALNALVARHEILRTTFLLADGAPQQQVNEAGNAALDYTDITHLDDEREKQTALNTIINTEFSSPFNLQKGPLMRTSIVRIQHREYIFLLSMHHIISDGWSVELLMKELLALYDAFLTNKPGPLAPLRIQYRDFAAWQNSLLQGEQLQRLEAYWLNQFPSEPMPLEVRTDFQRTSESSADGNVLLFELDKKTGDAVKAIAGEQGITTFMVLTAITALLLNRYTGRKDIIIGTPSATRNHPDLENQAGLYINILPLKIMLQPAEDNFISLLKNTKQVLLDAFAHGLYPYDMLVEKLQVSDQSSALPLINILVQSQQFLDDASVAPNGLQISHRNERILTNKVDITFNFAENGSRIQAAIEYNTALYTADTIGRIKNEFLHIAQSALDNKAALLTTISLPESESEKEEAESYLQMMMNVK
jgi:mycobactin peptide synthetase MbtE